jgi:hypothetical protein
MLKRVRLFYHSESKLIQSRSFAIKEWVRHKVNENIDNLVYKDDFSTIFTRNRERGLYVVYAHTHRDAQRAMRKFFKNTLTEETGHE